MMGKKEEGSEPQTILERLKALDPDRNIAFVAIDYLESPDEMRQFMREYTDWLATSEDLELQVHAEEVARANIGYITVYYGQEVVKRWQDVFKDIIHPVFGQQIPWGNPQESYEVGKAKSEIEQLEKLRGVKPL